MLLSHRQELSNEDLLEIEAEKKREEAAEAEAEKSEEQTMTAKKLSEALAKIREGNAMLEEMDPNVERSSRVTRKAMEAYFCYTEMEKEFSKKKRQTTMLQFFKKTEVEHVRPEEEDVDDPVPVKVDVDVTDTEVDSDSE